MFFTNNSPGGFHFIRVDKLASYLGTAEAGIRFLLGLAIGLVIANY